VDRAVHVGSDELDELLTEHGMGPYGIDDAVDREPLPQRRGQLGGRADTEVGRDQGGLEVVPGGRVDVVAGEQVGDPTSQGVLASCQPATKPYES